MFYISEVYSANIKLMFLIRFMDTTYLLRKAQNRDFEPDFWTRILINLMARSSRQCAAHVPINHDNLHENRPKM